MFKDPYINYRIAGSAVVLYTLVSFLKIQNQTVNEIIHDNPELKIFSDLGPRYFTVWNTLLQIVYSIISLVCDVTTLLNKESVISEGVRKFRYNLFCSLVFPISSAVLTFWAYFFYDRELIFPQILDQMISLAQNIMFHFGVFVYALWELVFLPRESIVGGFRAVKYLVAFEVAYILTLYYTKYVDIGVWCYEIMTQYEGTPIFYIPLVFPIIVAKLAYNAQWWIKDAVWRNRDKKLKE